MKNDRKQISSYLKSVMKKNTLSKSQKRALDKGQWPF
jgi:hypothetical protein